MHVCGEPRVCVRQRPHLPKPLLRQVFNHPQLEGDGLRDVADQVAGFLEELGGPEVRDCNALLRRSLSGDTVCAVARRKLQGGGGGG